MIKPHANRPSLEWARAIFVEHGAELLAPEYKNNATKMPYICRCGSRHEMSLGNLRRGRRCPSCSNRRSWNTASVREYMESQGCTSLETEYRGMNHSMRFICSCGEKSKSSFGNFFHKGVRCARCGIEKLSGGNAYQWKADKSDDERVKGRKFREYRVWRNAVFKRDDYTCAQCCERGGNLNAHHIDDWENHPEKRLDVENGVTLCRPCHNAFHRQYGLRTKTTARQFSEFMEAQHA